ARAKINWTLDITGQREDGYHLMDMLMQPVTLQDIVTLEPADTITLTTSGTPLLPPDESHLALRAARALQRHTGCSLGAAIHVEKHIPVGAGMGGGSADAAAVLAGLNRLWQLGLSQEELERVGLTLGADVPFCLRGGLTRTTGIGERMAPLPCSRNWPLVVIQPCEGLSTGAVFRAWHQQASAVRPATEDAARALAEGDLALLSRSLGNVLQPVSGQLRPEIAQAIDALTARGAAIALMTGSGSAVFGVFEREEDARAACDALRSRWERTWLCATCRESLAFPTWIETPRLIITDFTPDMARDLHLASLDEDMRRFLPDEVFPTEESARAIIAELTGCYGGMEGPFVHPVLLKDGAFIGYVELPPLDGGWEIGYHIAKGHTGHGYAAEAVSAFLPVIMARLGITQVQGVCRGDNLASRRVLEKCGFRRVFEGEALYHGAMHPVYRAVYSLDQAAERR
ncbi:MAG: 4-(cytidine 5'-diphospho)-2-C-methyl-D-erythritol kinase, partial [Aristaeellaceae bacterium]